MSPRARLVRTAAGAAMAAVLLGGLPSFGAPPTTSPTPGYDAATTTMLYGQVNAHRKSLGLRELAVDDKLAAVAQAWTTRMAATRTLAHNDALFTAASHQALGMQTLGENVGDTWAPERIHPMFLNSPHHRENIENPVYQYAGFAVVVDVTGQYWVTEDFGAAAAAPAPKPAPAPVVRRPAAPAPAPARPRTPARTVTPARARTVTPQVVAAAVVPPRAEATPRVDTLALAGLSPPVDPVHGGGRTAWAAVAIVAIALAGSSLLRLRRRARLAG